MITSTRSTALEDPDYSVSCQRWIVASLIKKDLLVLRSRVEADNTVVGSARSPLNDMVFHLERSNGYNSRCDIELVEEYTESLFRASSFGRILGASANNGQCIMPSRPQCLSALIRYES